jgi:hypothetical protein
MNPTLKAPGTKRLKLKYDKLLSILPKIAFNLNLRRYTTDDTLRNLDASCPNMAGRCRLTLSNPR